MLEIGPGSSSIPTTTTTTTSNNGELMVVTRHRRRVPAQLTTESLRGSLEGKTKTSAHQTKEGNKWVFLDFGGVFVCWPCLPRLLRIYCVFLNSS